MVPRHHTPYGPDLHRRRICACCGGVLTRRWAVLAPDRWRAMRVLPSQQPFYRGVQARPSAHLPAPLLPSAHLPALLAGLPSAAALSAPPWRLPVATLVAVGKAVHQSAMQDGSWHVASLLVPVLDPCGQEEFAGGADELADVVSYRKGLTTLDNQVKKEKR